MDEFATKMPGRAASESETLPALTSIARALDSLGEPLAELLSRMRENASVVGTVAATLQEFAGLSLGRMPGTLEAALPQGTTSTMTSRLENVPATAVESESGRVLGSDSNFDAAATPEAPSLERFAALLGRLGQTLATVSDSTLQAVEALGKGNADPAGEPSGPGLDSGAPAMATLAGSLESIVPFIERLAEAQFADVQVPENQETASVTHPASADAGPIAASSLTTGNSTGMHDALRSALMSSWSPGNESRSELTAPVGADGINRSLAELHELLETLLRDLPRSLAEAVATRSTGVQAAPVSSNLLPGKEASAAPGVAGGYRGIEAVLANTPASLGVSGVVGGRR